MAEAGVSGAPDVDSFYAAVRLASAPIIKRGLGMFETGNRFCLKFRATVEGQGTNGFYFFLVLNASRGFPASNQVESTKLHSNRIESPKLNLFT